MPYGLSQIEDVVFVDSAMLIPRQLARGPSCRTTIPPGEELLLDQHVNRLRMVRETAGAGDYRLRLQRRTDPDAAVGPKQADRAPDRGLGSLGQGEGLVDLEASIGPTGLPQELRNVQVHSGTLPLSIPLVEKCRAHANIVSSFT